MTTFRQTDPSLERAARHRGRRRPAPLAVAVGAIALLVGYGVGYTRTGLARAALGTRPAHLGQYRDGTYTGWGDSYHGRVLATVVIRRGRIASAEITTCRMRYPCSMIAALPSQVVARQSANVDLVTGASQSAEAFSIGVDRALAKAVREGAGP